MVYGLLALSVVVSLLGMINTLVLSVFERTRELGLLRAVGMTRRQARRMIRQESIMTALVGVALGLPIGLLLAALVTRALSDTGVDFAVPGPTLALFVVTADPRRRPRSHLPGPARLATQRARGAAVPVIDLLEPHTSCPNEGEQRERRSGAIAMAPPSQSLRSSRRSWRRAPTATTRSGPPRQRRTRPRPKRCADTTVAVSDTTAAVTETRRR